MTNLCDMSAMFTFLLDILSKPETELNVAAKSLVCDSLLDDGFDLVVDLVRIFPDFFRT